jgi:hypothetical protein
VSFTFSLEKELEDILFEDHEYMENYLALHGYTFFRQVNLGAYGIVDILGIRYADWGPAEIEIAIIELKNVPLTASHISQAARYRKFFLELEDGSPAPIDARAILVGPKTFPTNTDFEFLVQDIPWLQVYEYDLKARSGLSLNLVEGWRFTKENSSTEEKLLRLIGTVRTTYDPPSESANG